MSSSESFQSWEKEPAHHWHSDGPSYVSTRKLEAALSKASKRALEYDYQMRGLEAKLSESLSNFRAIDGLIQESHTGMQQITARAQRALRTQIPHIDGELEESAQLLTDLADTLPTAQSQITSINTTYDSGRQKAQDLVSDLRWLNTEFYERWRCIIFTSTSPVSWRWKASMRFMFVISFIVCSYLFWLLLAGAYRAHRHRLVWGERLMS